MTIELRMLAWTLVLAFIQIMLFGAARTKQYGSQWNTGARDEVMPPLSPVPARLQRAQLNLFETLPLFIAAVLIAQAAGRDNSLTAAGSQVYFWARVVYLPLYAFGVKTFRTLVWLASVVGLFMVIIPIMG